MDKEIKENKEMPEDPVDKNTGEDKIQDKAEKADEKTISEKSEQTKEQKEEKKETKTEEKPKAEKQKEKPKKQEKTDNKKQQKDDDFKYIVRLSNTDVDGEKNLIFGLTSIKGIGLKIAMLVAKETKIDVNKKIGNLSDKEVEIIQKAIDDVQNTAPSWMLNHRKDIETGKDIHLIGPEIDMRLRDEINILKKIRCYKGIRHERGLRVRGQKTKANNRSGLTLGVSKQRQK